MAEAGGEPSGVPPFLMSSLAFLVGHFADLSHYGWDKMKSTYVFIIVTSMAKDN